VLSRLIGRTPIEVGKSIALGFATLIALIALQQLAATRTAVTAGQSDRAAVLGVASDFGTELTTYDYAHPDVQQNRLAPLATGSVRRQVHLALADLQLYQAVSVGSTAGTYLQSLSSDRAEVLVATQSTMQSTYAPAGTRSMGLLLCEVERASSGWRVSGYRWLTPVTERVS